MKLEADVYPQVEHQEKLSLVRSIASSIMELNFWLPSLQDYQMKVAQIGTFLRSATIVHGVAEVDWEMGFPPPQLGWKNSIEFCVWGYGLMQVLQLGSRPSSVHQDAIDTPPRLSRVRPIVPNVRRPASSCWSNRAMKYRVNSSYLPTPSKRRFNMLLTLVVNSELGSTDSEKFDISRLSQFWPTNIMWVRKPDTLCQAPNCGFQNPQPIKFNVKY